MFWNFFSFSDAPNKYAKCYSDFRLFYSIGANIAAGAGLLNDSLRFRDDLISMLIDNNFGALILCGKESTVFLTFSSYIFVIYIFQKSSCSEF